MGFLAKYALTAVAITALILFIYDHTLGRLFKGATTAAVKPGVVASAGAVAAAILGMSGVTKGVKWLRQKTKDVDTKIGTLPKDVH